MSQFEIQLDDLESSPVELDFEPEPEQLEELFEAFDDEFVVDSEAPFHVDLYVMLDGTSIVVSGRASGTFHYKCGRCLQDRETEVDASVNVTMLTADEYRETYGGEEEISLDEEDLETTWYEGQSVDLGPQVRDAMLMELPAWPQCPDELRDSCDAAYEEHVGDETLDRLEEHEVDLRWWPLKDIDLEEEEEN